MIKIYFLKKKTVSMLIPEKKKNNKINAKNMYKKKR